MNSPVIWQARQWTARLAALLVVGLFSACTQMQIYSNPSPQTADTARLRLAIREHWSFWRTPSYILAAALGDQWCGRSDRTGRIADFSRFTLEPLNKALSGSPAPKAESESGSEDVEGNPEDQSKGAEPASSDGDERPGGLDHKDLGMPGGEDIPISTKAEIVIPANRQFPFVYEAFYSLSGTACTVSMTFIPQSGGNYEAEFKVTRGGCAILLSQLSTTGKRVPVTGYPLNCRYPRDS